MTRDWEEHIVLNAMRIFRKQNRRKQYERRYENGIQSRNVAGW